MFAFLDALKIGDLPDQRFLVPEAVLKTAMPYVLVPRVFKPCRHALIKFVADLTALARERLILGCMHCIGRAREQRKYKTREAGCQELFDGAKNHAVFSSWTARRLVLFMKKGYRFFATTNNRRQFGGPDEVFASISGTNDLFYIDLPTRFRKCFGPAPTTHLSLIARPTSTGVLWPAG